MRIISGKFRGKVLNSPKDLSVRPTSDKIKESIFNVLQFKIANSKFLDLFAGSGAMGIEALSRGASEVVFCDNSKDSIALIKSNLELIKTTAEINFCDGISFLKTTKKTFDIIYIDPPYAMREFAKYAQIVDAQGILNAEGWLIYEHSVDYCFGEDIAGYTFIKYKKYGNTVIEIYQKSKVI